MWSDLYKEHPEIASAIMKYSRTLLYGSDKDDYDQLLRNRTTTGALRNSVIRALLDFYLTGKKEKSVSDAQEWFDEMAKKHDCDAVEISDFVDKGIESIGPVPEEAESD